MISFLSSWSKSIGLTIVIISILEMLTPNNKIKKYIKAVMGLYVIFTIINPFINNKELLKFDDINLENFSYDNMKKIETKNSIDEKIVELSKKEIEKDIVNKLNEKGYEIKSCIVDLNVNKEHENSISKIEIIAIKKDNKENDNKNVENKMVSEIEKIKKVGSKVNHNEEKEKEKKALTYSDIKNIKDFLINEYGVDVNCLKIN